MRVARAFRPVVAALLLAVSGVAPAEAVPATVSGVEALNIRRGPGTEHAVFARLERGQKIEVTKIVGTWAAVRTPGGAEGWVQKQHLSFPGEQPPSEPAPQPSAERTQTGGRSGDVEQLREELAKVSAERDTLRAQLSETSPVAANATPATGDGGRLQADVQQLLQLTQELRQMVASQREHGGGSPAPIAETTEKESWLLSNGWVLTTSLIIGVLAGMVYGRAQERRRRNRIRF